jgi:hypothetical protein
VGKEFGEGDLGEEGGGFDEGEREGNVVEIEASRRPCSCLLVQLGGLVTAFGVAGRWYGWIGHALGLWSMEGGPCWEPFGNYCWLTFGF